MSAPFASRELNGDVLLDELADLRLAKVQQKQLNECVAALRPLAKEPVSVAVRRLKHVSSAAQAEHPTLGRLLAQWGNRLKHDGDVAALVGHFERLATVSAVVGALRRSAERIARPK